MQAHIIYDKKCHDHILLAGPWIGEFGWELFCWQGYLRARSKEFEKVVISSRPEMHPLYIDFCEEFIPFTPNGPGISGFKCNGYNDWPDISDMVKFKEYISGNFNIGYNRKNPDKSSNAFFNQVFFKYGKFDKKLSFDVVLHIRQTDKNNSSRRNGWELDIWKIYLNALRKEKSLSICCIGHPQSAGLLDGCIDMRGLHLNKLFDLLSSSSVLVGPSSGPMHLGALCGCPHIVWSGVYENQPKYEKYWNPFSTPVKYLHHPEWKPPVNIVIEQTLEFLNNLS